MQLDQPPAQQSHPQYHSAEGSSRAFPQKQGRHDQDGSTDQQDPKPHGHEIPVADRGRRPQKDQ